MGKRMKNIINSEKLIDEMESLDNYFTKRSLSFNEVLLVIERTKQKILMNQTLDFYESNT